VHVRSDGGGCLRRWVCVSLAAGSGAWGPGLPTSKGFRFVCDEVYVLLLPGRAGAEAGRGGGGKDALFVELWKACAGPLSCVPPLGEKVYYLPQGHIEQVRQTGREGALAMPVSRYCCGCRRCILAFFEALLGYACVHASESSPNFA
jgi:hypothetical protein